MAIAVPIDREEIASYCRRWSIREFALFGSVLGSDFRSDSDVDVLVTFSDEAPWSLWDLTLMRDELVALFGRNVDIVEKRAIKNPHRRRTILGAYEVIHAA